MRRWIRWFFRLVAGLVAVVLLLASAAAIALWRTLPPADHTIRVPGLTAPVEVAIDTDGIPRIHARTDLDAAAAIGFLHARDRMFQMELTRRAASGRLSEIAGPATLPTDRMMRTLGLARGVTSDLAALPLDTRAMLDAYARGVNAWIEARGRFAAPEFLVLGAPEPWRPSDSLLWAKTMGLYLSGNWRTELSRRALAGKVPDQLINELWPPDGGPGHPEAALPPSTQFAAAVTPLAAAAAAARLDAVLPRFPAPFTLPSSASNEWAVDGRHSATGAPLLAGDPHLGFGFPSVWYLARIETPTRLLAGATAPGVPFLIIGHNGHIAWTFTNTGADVQDLFIEAPDGPFTVREEVIKVRGQPDEVLTVRETRHGPVISDLITGRGPILAAAMGNLRPGDTAAQGLLALNQATDVRQAGLAAPVISAPVQNLLVADRAGIALFMTGAVPVRRAGDGSRAAPGDGSHDWIGWASGDSLPHIIGPVSGRLVNANERVAPPDFPVFLGRDWFSDWRARRIREMLTLAEPHTAAGFTRMQVDATNLFARAVVPVLLSAPVSDPAATRARDLLRDWDGTMAADLPQPLIFNAWIDRFNRLILRRHGIAPEHGGPTGGFVSFVLSPAGAHWCEGDCGKPLAEALDLAVRDLSTRFGADPSLWRWGTAHQAVFAHPMLRGIPWLGPLTTQTIPQAGDDNTVGRGGLDSRYQSVHGAGFRGVYDLADLDRSLFVVAPGQSGNPLSHHAGDFLTRWRDGGTVTIGPRAASVEAVIRLTP